FSGAPTRGPRRSSNVSSCAAGRPSTTTARRRAVANPSSRSNSSPASFSPSPTRRARSAAAFACMRAGISSENSSSSNSAIGILHEMAARFQPATRTGLGERPHPPDIGGALGHADDAARIEDVEEMARLHALVIGRERKAGRQNIVALALRILEMPHQDLDIGMFEIIGGEFLFILQENVAVSDAGIVPFQVEHIVNALHIHGETFKPVGQLARNGVTLEPADLLEEGELTDLHPVAPDFPAEPPGAERRAFPVIFNK